MGEFGVGGDTDDLGVDRLELVQSGVEREDLSWADDWACQRGSDLCETGSGDSDSGDDCLSGHDGPVYDP